MKKFFNYTFFILFIAIAILFAFSFPVYGAYPKLINKLISAFENIKSYIVAIATPIATVAIRFWFLNAKI